MTLVLVLEYPGATHYGILMLDLWAYDINKGVLWQRHQQRAWGTTEMQKHFSLFLKLFKGVVKYDFTFLALVSV